MIENPPRKDLVVLTTDKNAQFAVRGILSRFQSLGIRQLTPDYYLHPGKDSGVLHTAHDFLRSFSKIYMHALVIMDREGSGQDEIGRVDMEATIETALGKSGWDDRAAVVVIDPELDIWVWSDSPHLDHELGWSGCRPDLRSWLRSRNHLAIDARKPHRPKEALEAALKHVRKPRSSALYQAIAERVSLVKCTDLAFVKLKTVLQKWFSSARS
jgi:hypothetical protein